jgi:hypothetical protein
VPYSNVLDEAAGMNLRRMLPPLMTLVFAFMFIAKPSAESAAFMFAAIALQAAWNILESRDHREETAFRVHAAIASAASGGLVYSFITLLSGKTL